MRSTLLTIIAAMSLLLSIPASGDLILFSGSASGTPTGSGYNGPAPVTVSFSFTFDDSVVPGTGFALFNPLLDSITVTPDPLGITTFTPANSTAQVEYLEGAFFQVVVFGNENGEGNLVGTDDFLVRYSSSLAVNSLRAITTDSTTSGSAVAPTGSLTLTVIPEPSSAILIGCGLLGLAMRRQGRASV